MTNNRMTWLISSMREIMTQWGPVFHEIRSDPNFSFEERLLLTRHARELMAQALEDLRG